MLKKGCFSSFLLGPNSREQQYLAHSCRSKAAKKARAQKRPGQVG
ncbi:hypothetical protein SGRA_2520 [Saprospira grandis str. Lewin]|uniref:Uncharacterized protein n=1 Tax=Saprospira grandis (strain Lewin) TaxID=984262 RepID=H6L6K2_SAPGL|nr:hypothetical protein SGRA_2520 [Saprospira grandis str. Lewin]